jgi:hypothetical protein
MKDAHRRHQLLEAGRTSRILILDETVLLDQHFKVGKGISARVLKTVQHKGMRQHVLHPVEKKRRVE